MSRPFIPASNCASVELIYSFNGEIVENVFHVRKSSPYSLADLQALRGVVDTWDNTYWKTGRSAGCVLIRIRTRALDSAGSATEDYYLPAPRAGTVGAAALPANVAFCVKLGTALAGRSHRGRMYITGLTQGALGPDANHILPVVSAAYVSLLNQLMTDLATAGHTLVVVSYRADGAWRTTAEVTTAIGWTAVDNNVDAMRRRLTGRGHT